ncbi:ABC transporter permease [Terasakiella sp.]|uniref:ABC transporter permease n=1 Tax=Terasakiella sp. TaxID=2034861 RepID=UPI003AA9DA25
MLVFTLKRLLASIPTLFAVLTVIFVLVRIVPGDPALAVLGDSASEEVIQEFRKSIGIDKPLWEQYLVFMGDVLQGDLGTSMATSKTVVEEVSNVLPYTLELTVASIIIGVVFGIPLGIFSAIYRNHFFDYLARMISLLGLSFPAFYISILFMIYLSVEWDWFPVFSEYIPWSDPLTRLYHLTLPALSLGVIMIGYVARTSRSSMLEVLGEDYIRTAKSKGLPRNMVVFKHGFRNALIPILTLTGLYLGLLMGNSVLTEIVFNRPGLGGLIVGSLESRDYTMLQGLIVTYAFFIVLANLITDISYGLVDPRVKNND